MPNENHMNIESTLIQFLNDLVHEKTMLFFRTKDEYPVDKGIVLANAFYGKILIDVALCREPQYDDFAGMPFVEGADVVYQAAIYLFHCWKTMGLTSAVFNYCKNINRLMERSAKAKNNGSPIMLPDFFSCQQEIYEKIKNLTKEHQNS